MKDKELFKKCMQAAILECLDPAIDQHNTLKSFIVHEATYERLLNLCFTSSIPNTYMEAEVLEGLFSTLLSEMYCSNDKCKKTVLEATGFYKKDRIHPYVGFHGSRKIGVNVGDKKFGIDIHKKINPFGSKTTADISNPLAWALTGVALLAGSWYIYRKILKKNKGDKVKAAEGAISATKKAMSKSKMAKNPKKFESDGKGVIAKWKARLKKHKAVEVKEKKSKKK